MPEQETYKHAPSIEAVLDIRTRLSSELSQESLNNLYEREKAAYPTIRRPFQVNFKIERKNANEEPTTDISSVANGLTFVSDDGLQLFQARPDGFSHNRLAPYTNWISFSSEARRLWVEYRNIAKPEVIEMLGLNFVNKIDFPAGSEISDYFKAYVVVPKELPQVLETHNFAIQMTDPASNAKIAVIVNFGAINSTGRVPVTMNIQAFTFVNKSINEINEDAIWHTFETLRNLKNLAFESAITEKVRVTFR